MWIHAAAAPEQGIRDGCDSDEADQNEEQCFHIDAEPVIRTSTVERKQAPCGERAEGVPGEILQRERAAAGAIEQLLAESCSQ